VIFFTCGFIQGIALLYRIGKQSEHRQNLSFRIEPHKMGTPSIYFPCASGTSRARQQRQRFTQRSQAAMARVSLAESWMAHSRPLSESVLGAGFRTSLWRRSMPHLYTL